MLKPRERDAAMRSKWVTIAAALVGTVLLAGPALAQSQGAQGQQLEIQVIPLDPAREPVVVPPGDHYENARPSDSGYYAHPPRVRHDPAYIRPLSVRTQTPTATGRAGVAGWTAPNTPAGPPQAGWNEVNGWFALGLAVEWGGPPPKRPVAR
jgi:hypothetical protein